MINLLYSFLPDHHFGHGVDSDVSSHGRRDGVRGASVSTEIGEKARDERGDTLIEVLLSLIILGLASLAMIVAFGTSLTASGQHRNLTTAETYAKTVANHVVSSVQASSANFSCTSPSSTSTYASYITSNGVTPPTGYSATVSSLQFWDKSTSSWSSNCIDNAAQLIVVTVTSPAGASYTSSVVVVNPGASKVVVSTAATQLVFTVQPGAGAVNAPLSIQPQVAYEDSSHAIATNYLASNPVSITAYPMQLNTVTHQWAISGSGFAPINCVSQASNGYISFTGCEIDTVGNYVLQATDGKFTTAPSSMFAVDKGTNAITISSTQGPVTLGGSSPAVTYTPSATALGGTVVITSATPGVCTVSSSDVVSFIGAGVCAINFSDAGDASWNAAPTLAQGISVYLTNTITVGSAPAAVVNGPTYTPTATAASGATAPPGTSGTIVVTSTTTGVCTVSPSDVVSFIAAGTCSLLFSDTGNQTYVATSLTQSFSVGKGANVITVSSTPPSPSVYGATYTPTATATSGATAPPGTSGTIVVTSATPSECSIALGVVTFIHVGVANCTLNFNDAGNSNYVAAAQVQQTISVTAAPLTVQVSGSQDFGRAPVFTPQFVGFVNGDKASAVSGSLTCRTDATATSHPAGGFSISACSGLSATNYTLTYSYGNLTVAKATPTITWSDPAAILYGTPLGSTQLDASASVAGTLVYNPAAGVILTSGTHTLTVAFTPSDTIDYSSASSSVSLVVRTRSQTLNVSASPLSLPWSSTSTVSASGQSGTGAVSYLLDTGNNGQTSSGSCSVNSTTGVVSAQGTGTCEVYATIASDPTYSAATSSDVAVTFTKVPQDLYVDASPLASIWSTANLSDKAPGTGAVTYQVVGSTGTSLIDLSAAGNNPAVIPGSATGVALGAAGPPLIGGAVSFSGATGSYLETAQPFDSSATAAAGSISIWFNTRSSGPIMGASNLQTDASPTNWDRLLWVDSAGYLVGGVYNNDTVEVTSTTVVSDGQWHLATLTWGSPDGETLYLDGVQVATNSKGTSAQIYGGGTGYWHIGYNTRNSWPDNNTNNNNQTNNINYFIGSLARAAAYQSELTPTQVQSLYAATSVASENSTILGLSPTSYWPLDDAACKIISGVNPQQIVASSPGSCYFSGSIATDANYLAATSAVVSVQLAPTAQSITATDIVNRNSNGKITSYTISSANSLGTGTISYHIDSAYSGSSCQLSGVKLTAFSGTTCNVYVTIAADSLYAEARSVDLPLTFTSNNNGSN